MEMFKKHGCLKGPPGHNMISFSNAGVSEGGIEPFLRAWLMTASVVDKPEHAQETATPSQKNGPQTNHPTNQQANWLWPLN